MGDFERGQIQEATGRTSREIIRDLLLTDKWEDDYNQFPEVKAAFETLVGMLRGMVDGILNQAKESGVSNRALIKHLQEGGMQGHTLMLSTVDEMAKVEQYVSPSTTDFRLDGVEEFFGMTLGNAAARASRNWRQEYEGTFPPPERCAFFFAAADGKHKQCFQVEGHSGDCGAEVGD